MVSIRPINNWEREKKKDYSTRKCNKAFRRMCFSRARVSHLKDAMTTKMYNFNSIAGISDLDQKITDGHIYVRKSPSRDVFESSWIYCQTKQFAEKFAKKEKKLSILSPKPRRDFWWKSWDVEMMLRPLSLLLSLFLSLLSLSSSFLSSVKLSGSNQTWRGEWPLDRGRSRWNASSRG